MGRNTTLHTTTPSPLTPVTPSVNTPRTPRTPRPTLTQKQLPQDLKNVAKYLGDEKASKLKLRQGILFGKRASYFKGNKAINALLSSNYPAKCRGPKITTQEEASTVLQTLLSHQVLLRCDKPENASSSKTLMMHPTQLIDGDSLYVYLYEGSKLPTIMGGVLLLCGIMAWIMMPIMPPFVHTGMRYVSYAALGFLAFLAVLGVIRLILFIITIFVAKPGIWLFPNLFEDCGFFESFVPLWAWHQTDAELKKAKKEEKKKRREKRAKRREEKERKKREKGEKVGRSESESFEEVRDGSSDSD